MTYSIGKIWSYFLNWKKDNRADLKERVQNEINQQRNVAIYYIDIVKFTDIEWKYGQATTKRILKVVDDKLNQAALDVFIRPFRVVAQHQLWGDDFAVFVSWDTNVNDEYLHHLCVDFKDKIEAMINETFLSQNNPLIQVHLGFARLKGKDISKELYTSMKFASQMAKFDIQTEEFLYHRQFIEILEKEDIKSLYQPIISLKDGSPLGWESLARGPENSYFFSPIHLFDYADKMGRSVQLESICRKKAFEKSKHLQPNHKIFINLDPRFIDDHFFLRGQATKLLESYGLLPSNIVFEITERHAITNFSHFRKIIEKYRKIGYLIAVDDAGAGYSSLEAITEIYPDFIKLDMSLVRGIHADPVKRAIVEAFAMFSSKVKCRIIAEGIETEDEIRTLMELGIDFGQGYFLGKPAKGFRSITGEALVFFENAKFLSHLFHEENTPLTRITVKTPSVKSAMKIKDLHLIFEENNKIDCVVVVENNQPIGLIMRYQLYRVLGGKYGISLYYEKRVDSIMNPVPLIVDRNMSIEEVSKQAMARDTDYLYDVILVIDSGHYIGTVTVQMLLDTIAKEKLERAVYANPLTGLPGNLQIEKELTKRLKSGSIFYVVYCDLDHFKKFNDAYGFETGDQLIMKTARIIELAVKSLGEVGDFVGHIGGDDFIFISSLSSLDEVVDYIREQFTTAFKSFSELSISLAAIHIRPGESLQVKEISHLAAQAKKEAKKIQGFSFVCNDNLLGVR